MAGDRARGSLSDIPGPLVALGSGIGGLAFVTFVGGAISLARFRGAGIPGTGALAHVPKSDLLAVGADQLFAPFVVAAFAAVYVTVLGLFVRDRMRERVLAGWLAAWVVAALATYWLRVEPPTLSDKDDLVAAAATVLTLTAGGAVIHAALVRAPAGARWSAGVAARVFGIAALVASLTTYAHALTHPALRAAAFSAGPRAELHAGLYVGEDDAAIYTANVAAPDDTGRAPKASGRIVETPREAVHTVLVGYTEDLPDAICHEHRLLRLVRAAPAPDGLLRRPAQPEPPACREGSRQLAALEQPDPARTSAKVLRALAVLGILAPLAWLAVPERRRRRRPS